MIECFGSRLWGEIAPIILWFCAQLMKPEEVTVRFVAAEPDFFHPK